MALPIKVEKLESVPEAHRGLYKAVEGGFALEVDGLEDTTGLKTALEKERTANKNSKKALDEAIAAALAPFAGIDPVKTKALLSKFDNEEEAALIAAGKFDDVIGKRMEKARTELQKQLDLANGKVQQAETVASKYRTRVLDNQIRAAAAKSGLHPFAVDDALLRARTLFTLSEDGDAVQLDDNGAPVLGKDGKTIFTPTEWLESMKESAPHWFSASNSGGGAGGSGGGNAGGKTMKRVTFDALSPAQKSEAVKTHSIVD